ncbi:MAG: DUF2000 family protein [Pseudomonadota bacterium]
MQFDTKFAIVVRDDLETWQKLNVTAFLTSGVIGNTPEMMGAPYLDREGNRFHSLSVQPCIVLAADAGTICNIHRRALSRGVIAAAYTEEMFATGHDEANREVFSQFGPDDAKIVGIALRADKKLVDKITKGAKLHG